MCTNYRPGSRDYIRGRFGLEADFDYPEEAYPAYPAPMLRLGEAGLECVPACFGLIPHWSTDTKIARSTYNARSETVAQKPSYRRPWRLGQRCLVPMRAFYEPSYASGRAVRWRIEALDGGEFCVAGIWDAWQPPAGAGPGPGGSVLSFSLLTINADAHPLMSQFHAPGDEKRSLVVLEPEAQERWLRADADAARALLQPLVVEHFQAQADPRVARAGKSPSPPVNTSASLWEEG